MWHDMWTTWHFGYLGTGFFMILVVGALIVTVSNRRRPELEVLEGRLASGEIDEDEFKRIRDLLSPD